MANVNNVKARYSVVSGRAARWKLASAQCKIRKSRSISQKFRRNLGTFRFRLKVLFPFRQKVRRCSHSAGAIQGHIRHHTLAPTSMVTGISAHQRSQVKVEPTFPPPTGVPKSPAYRITRKKASILAIKVNWSPRHFTSRLNQPKSIKSL